MNEYNQEQIATEIAELLNSDRFLDALIGKTGGAQSGGSLVVRSNGRQVTAIAVGEVPPGDCVALRDTNTGQWYAVSSYDEGKNDDHLIRYRKWRQPDDEVVYPVITLFSIEEEETTRIYLGGNKSSKRMTARDGEYIDIPSEISGDPIYLRGRVQGFISGKNIHFNYTHYYAGDYIFSFLSIIQGQKYLVFLDGEIAKELIFKKSYINGGFKYIGDGVWVCHRWSGSGLAGSDQRELYWVSRDRVADSHIVVASGGFENYLFNIEDDIDDFVGLFKLEYETWNGNCKESIELTGIYKRYSASYDINVPILNFKSAYFLQEFKANVTGLLNTIETSEERIYTQEVNRIKLISKDGSTPEREINSDDFVRLADNYTLESELTINSESLTFNLDVVHSGDMYDFQPDFMIDMPILFSRAIGDDNYLVYGNISDATIEIIESDNFFIADEIIFTISIDITKKVKRPCSFQGLLSNNGSFYSYYYKNNPPIDFISKQRFIDDQPNLFRQYFNSESVVQLDSLKGSKIYSVISPRISTTTTASFVQPAVGSSVTVSVVDSSWMSPGLTIYLQDGGNYTVVSKPSSTSVIIIRLRVGGTVGTSGTVTTSRTVSIPPEAASKIDNPVYVEVWKIMEDGKILYSDLITVDYYNITKFLDIRDTYAHNYII